MSQFRCQIVTPSEAVLDEEVSYVSFPAWDGQVGVLAGTSAFLTEIGAGSLRIDFASGPRLYLLDGGFAQMQGEERHYKFGHIRRVSHMQQNVNAI